LKKSLYELFAQFGPVLEVVASKGIRMRGQAWVVFRDLECANAAKRKLTDAIFFDKAMQIEYAKSKSDVVAKADGTFVRRAKRTTREVNRQQDPEKRAAKKRLLAAKNRGTAGVPLATPLADTAAPPNKLLFIQNLPRKRAERWFLVVFFFC
jgi:RNA recognition motif-containing protein